MSATKTGATSVAIAACRPSMPIITATSDKRVAGQLALSYASASFVCEFGENYEIDLVQDLKEKKYMKTPEGKDTLTVVVVSGTQDEAGMTNRIQIREI